MLLPTIASLKTKLTRLKNQHAEKPFKYGHYFVQTCLDAIEKRFKHCIELNSMDEIIAAVVHPKFKFRWLNALKTNNYDHKVLQEKVLNQIKSILKFQFDEKKIDSPKKSTDNFFDFGESETDLDISSNFLNSGQNKIDLEFLNYLEDKRTNLAMLDDYKNIKQIFLKYNTALTASAAVERLFSFAEIINAPKRNATSDSNFEKLVLLKNFN